MKYEAYTNAQLLQVVMRVIRELGTLSIDLAEVKDELERRVNLEADLYKVQEEEVKKYRKKDRNLKET